jgi:hypothetical protein
MADKTPEQVLTGQSLAKDRGVTAREVTLDIEDWKLKTNVLDYSGYDVQKKIIPEKLRLSLEKVFEEEPERLVRVLKQYSQTKITDWQSFRRAFEEVFSVGSPINGVMFFEKVAGQEDLMMDLFANPKLQELITVGGEEEGAKTIQKQFAHLRALSMDEAKAMWRQRRRHEVQLVAKGWFPIHQYELEQYQIDEEGRVLKALPPLERSPTARMGYLIAQKTKEDGILYRRAKPKAFSKAQERFLLKNPQVPASKITSQFNILFDMNRTQQSIYYKRYRLLKQQGG